MEKKILFYPEIKKSGNWMPLEHPGFFRKESAENYAQTVAFYKKLTEFRAMPKLVEKTKNEVVNGK